MQLSSIATNQLNSFSLSNNLSLVDRKMMVIAAIAVSILLAFGMLIKYFSWPFSLKKEPTPINNQSPLPVVMPIQTQKSRIQEISSKSINSQGDRLVCFYKSGPTDFLGNFTHCPSSISIWGKTFQCAEAAFQWKKYSMAADQNQRVDMQNDPKMNEFFTCDGEQAFQLRKYFDKDYPKVFTTGWLTGVRDQVMWEVLQAKFSQNQEFNKRLQETSGAYLLEHNKAPRDDYWSDHHDGSGKNMLGEMLMAIRDQRPCPASKHLNQDKIRAFANIANQHNALGYEIF